MLCLPSYSVFLVVGGSLTLLTLFNALIAFLELDYVTKTVGQDYFRVLKVSGY